MCLRSLFGLLAIALPVAFFAVVWNPGDYRLVHRYIYGAVSLLGIPFQLIFSTLGIDSFHNIGIPAQTLGVVTGETILVLCIRVLKPVTKSTESKR